MMNLKQQSLVEIRNLNEDKSASTGINVVLANVWPETRFVHAVSLLCWSRLEGFQQGSRRSIYI
jgi:hypothetical protein